MKLKLKKEVEVEIEVTFPVYLTHLGYSFVKVISEEETLVVREGNIGKTSISSSYLTDENYNAITEEVFNKHYKEVLKSFQNEI